MSSFTVVLLLACFMTYNCILNSFVDKVLDYSCAIEDKTHKIVAELVWFVLPLWILHIPEVAKRLSYKWWLKVPVIAVFPPLFMTCVCLRAVLLPLEYFGQRIANLITVKPKRDYEGEDSWECS